MGFGAWRMGIRNFRNPFSFASHNERPVAIASRSPERHRPSLGHEERQEGERRTAVRGEATHQLTGEEATSIRFDLKGPDMMSESKTISATVRAEREPRREWVKPIVHDMVAGSAEAAGDISIDGSASLS